MTANAVLASATTPANGGKFNPIAYHTAGGSVVTRHYTVNGERVAVRVGGTLYYLYRDQVGSTILATDALTNVVGSRGYYAFGATRRSSGLTPTDRRFTGQVEDPTGLYYYNSRYYDPQLGQFISPDTIVPEPTNLLSYNRYLYAKGNPLKYTDPSGHCATELPAEEDPEAMAAYSECWRQAGVILGMYDSDPWWQEYFQVDRQTFFERVVMQPAYDAEWMGQQINNWQSAFAARTGTTEVEWHEAVNPPIDFPGKTAAQAVLDDILDCQENAPWGCSNLADDASLALAGGAVIGCAATTGGLCMAAMSTTSTVFSATGTAITTVNALRGDATMADASVSLSTTVVGYKYGPIGFGVVGATASVAQRVYDWWASQ
ncbi:MAG: RHS repeat-associated core domain-containing protein [Caldilineaceae bacterium]